MSQHAKSFIGSIEETMKLPRENGELIFHNPWESRIFAMAVLLSDKGLYPWKSFNGEFVKEIGEAEKEHSETDVASSYYHLWAQALEKLLLEQHLLTQEQLVKRTDEFTSGQRHHVC
ncbi:MULTISPECIES: nitrile hydratase accessory protein [unclassified Paenibacillus]|uniref:nitrile hydratase accessory protein n=1 Tax=unclassified Paenibacillus TaxID=185978 RepID=UPI001AE35E52|nr:MULTISPECIES: nitrile hydratase accessory protein [unclassified Paenibacillus]MBP1154114.1 nitrile hydratase [Paenibacillus sp. PvP091]MBP1170501.1 nitrile hydratase [Paenibacillus sp. PvR098]MBP2441529.1 nitrile hydratase [Paenibacillus sp. PvP052]